MIGQEKLNWNFTSLDQLHYAVNSTLKYAMQNERCKKWDKVLETYKLLLWMIDKKNLPEDYEPPSSYIMLLYETYYHMGVGYQHLGDHKKAVIELTNAIDMMSLPKNGCLAGCVTNTCLMTPLYARRAFAYARSGDMKNAMKDAERTVVLDSRNPDVYCIRALVKSTHNEIPHALKDLDMALKLNSSHVTALTLRAAISKPMPSATTAEVDSCLNVTDFRHRYIMEFYDKYFFTLCVPHTIIQIDLTPEKPSKKQIESNPELYRTSGQRRPESAPERIPFKCGTPLHDPSGGNMSTRRRLDYGEALRKHIIRPRTASAFFEQLERERQKKAELEEMALRKKIVAGVKKLAENANARKAVVERAKSVTPKATSYTPDMYTPDSSRRGTPVSTKSILKQSSPAKDVAINLRDVTPSPVETAGRESSAKGTRKTTSAMSIRTVTSGYGSARTTRSYTSYASEKPHNSESLPPQKRVTYKDDLTQNEDKENVDSESMNNSHENVKKDDVRNRQNKQIRPFKRQTISSVAFSTNEVPHQTTNSGSSTTMTVLPSSLPKFAIPTPTSYSIPVFQPTNIKDAPRMYYKPWSGDRLPPSEVTRHVHTPAWY